MPHELVGLVPRGVLDSIANHLASEKRVTITGLAGSFRAVLVAAVYEYLNRQVLLVVHDEDDAERSVDDLRLLSPGEEICLWSGKGRPGARREEHAPAENHLETLQSLAEGRARIVVTDAKGLAAKLPHPRAVEGRMWRISVGKSHDLVSVMERLNADGFERTDFVETAGEYSVRGGILDVFPHVGEHPVRIEFLEDTVESLREIDPLSQRSIKHLQSATIVANLLEESREGASVRESSLLDFLARDAVVIFQDEEVIAASIEKGGPDQECITWDKLRADVHPFARVSLQSFGAQQPEVILAGAHPQPSFNGSVRHLRKNLLSLQQDGYRIILLCDTNPELARLRDLLAAGEEGAREHEDESDGHFVDLEGLDFRLHALHEGFLLVEQKVAVYTEHQVFNRLKRRGRKRRARFRGLTEGEARRLHRGDFVVHDDFGIGRFSGLERIRVHNVEQEVLSILYQDGDKLYVNLHSVNRVRKYASREGHIPQVTKLGSSEWDRLRSRARKRIKDIARDLITLYARRKEATGFAFERDTTWQKELEASFMYEDTFDQAKATQEVKRDMEIPHPMDRLICGDVGFGKTEVAVRAAFKAVLGGKQVAVLVPTTILATQHFHTFVDRMSRYSVQVDVLSRFRTKKEQVTLLERLAAGTLDIIIGTHRLLSGDVAFKNLGLLIIDEEHRFGVAAKEKLRQMRMEVDTLTLTATPIPRTLHFSLLGARDLSIIATPPRNRLPIITEMTQYTADLITEAVLREVRRGGQVYFVHDRVQRIEEEAARLRTILPGIRIGVAHGQMQARTLERVMMDFLGRKLDLLVCTKIIESGLDIPNVNTIIINRADRFGMAELYQLRGRVGRSNVQAYAYLLTPPIEVLPRATLQRLLAVEEFVELGSGFNLAMRDLEIRGAGNLLGSEQSGFIDSMGFETYTRILDEAVHDLKKEEFGELFKEDLGRRDRKTETLVETDFEALIPQTYVERDVDRLELYRRLYALSTREQIDEIASEMEDRFGRLPESVRNLLGVVKVRVAASRIGFTRVGIYRDRLELEFPPESESSFYAGDLFPAMMHRISRDGALGVTLHQEAGILRLVSKKGLPSQPTLLLQHTYDLIHRLTEQDSTPV